MPFASRFPLPHFTLAVLFALSFPISSTPFRSLSSALLLFAAISEIREITVDLDNNDNTENPEGPADEPPIFHTKKFRIGSGNIIGKGVIQDFFTCAGDLPSMGCSILHRTSSLADAIAMLVVELERQFMHMHPYKEFS